MYIDAETETWSDGDDGYVDDDEDEDENQTNVQNTQG